MRSQGCGRSTLWIALATAFLVSCGGAQSPIGGPLNSSTAASATGKRTPRSVTYVVLHSFHDRVKANFNDGRHPYGALAEAGGTVYGTTFFGGDERCGRNLGGRPGCGTVFAVSPSGTESVLYGFTGGANGQTPASGVRNIRGKLFGTTVNGGVGGFGTVYSITRAGTQTVLYSFAGTPDGANPSTTPIDFKGTLYGSTDSGGKDGDGTVYAIAASGAESVLHSFAGQPKDGSGPVSALINVHGTLYGTTRSGGANDDGTVFSIAPSGAETILYSFKGGTSDGASPRAPLVYLNGKFYGTTFGGGPKSYGTVFSMTLSGTETVIHSFIGRPKDGAYPRNALINVGGTLYGTTDLGGQAHYGTIFSMTPSGTETILHSFTGSPSDGTFPEGPLLNVNGTLYGTTWQGGTYRFGTVFALTP